MYTLFLGGMSRYFLDSASGLLAEDSLVPFVRTVSMVTRFADGSMSESALPLRLPELMGTNAYFLPNPDLYQRHHHVIALEVLSGSFMLGWIYGGISSPAANISDTDPALSWATPEIYEVWIRRTTTVGMEDTPVREPVLFTATPNPADENLLLTMSAPRQEDVQVWLMDESGRKISEIFEGHVSPQPIRKTILTQSLAPGLYYLRLLTTDYSKTLPVVIRH
jgi:hypothetical protein